MIHLRLRLFDCFQHCQGFGINLIACLVDVIAWGAT